MEIFIRKVAKLGFMALVLAVIASLNSMLPGMMEIEPLIPAKASTAIVVFGIAVAMVCFGFCIGCLFFGKRNNKP